MDGRQIKAIVLIAACLLILVGILAVQTCTRPAAEQVPPSTEAGQSPSSTETVSVSAGDAPVHFNPPAVTSREEVGQRMTEGDGTALSAGQIAGLEEADWLSDEEKQQLVSGLQGRYWAEGHLDEKHFEIVGGHEDNGFLKELYVRDVDTGKTYLCNVGGRYGVYDLTKHVEGVNDEEFAALEEGTQGMDAYSELNSVETEFDQRNAVPLSYEAVEEILPADVLNRLYEDVNESIAPMGGHVDGEINIMVSRDAVQGEDGSIQFDIMAYSGVDQAVIRCTYDAAANPVSFELMP